MSKRQVRDIKLRFILRLRPTVRRPRQMARNDQDLAVPLFDAIQYSDHDSRSAWSTCSHSLAPIQTSGRAAISWSSSSTSGKERIFER